LHFILAKWRTAKRIRQWNFCISRSINGR
jgi:hypothetical protein